MKQTDLIYPAILSILIFLTSCTGSQTGGGKFFCVEGGQFIRPAAMSAAPASDSEATPAANSENTPYYYIGTNFWYGAILASDTQYGDRERLAAELDSLKAMGIENLRILVGGDGPSDIPSQIEPSLQTEPGIYDEALFQGLDYLLVELNKRRMSAVLYLNNAWEWSGGYARYLEWAGSGPAVLPSQAGWPAYMQYASQFVTNDAAKKLFADHVKSVVGRVNSITGKAYTEDPAIFSWQIANEPRCFSSDDSVKTVFADWLWETAALIKSLDPNHMVSTGSEGSWGCENDMALYEKIHSCPDIDYMTIHVWPYNWSWTRADKLAEDLSLAIANTDKYIADHIAVAEKYGKPIAIEEFGFPRDGFRFDKGGKTTARDSYYSQIFDKVIASKKSCGVLAGANFWGWGGMAHQSGETYWRPGDDYCGDPAQEQQGLNSVYIEDESTINLISNKIEELEAAGGIMAEAILENEWMYSPDRPAKLHVAVKTSAAKASAAKTLAANADADALVLTLLTDKGDTLSMTKKPLEGRTPDTLSFTFKLKPGFYQAIISVPATTGNTDRCSGTVLQKFNIGCDPEKISSPQDKQADFEEFWAQSLDSLAKTAPEYRLTLIPERSNDIRRTWRVDMKSFGGEDISGIYIEPVKEGKFPIFISYMGYGAQMWYNDPSARPDVAEFTLCVRNQGLNRLPGEADDWVTRGIESKETYYYRGAFMDVVRAIDFAASREKTDTSRIFAEGGSQGGAFTLVSASLDKRIKAIAPFVPFLSDFPDYFSIANWPAWPVTEKAKALGLSDEDLYRILSYFDIKNFTDRITCPVLMGFGLQDWVCPPHTNFSGYNLITAPKRYLTFPLAGHHVEEDPRWWQERDAFFQQYL